MTIPSFVRWAVSVSEPAGVWSAGVGDQEFVRVSTSIGRHWPRNT